MWVFTTAGLWTARPSSCENLPPAAVQEDSERIQMNTCITGTNRHMFFYYTKKVISGKQLLSCVTFARFTQRPK